MTRESASTARSICFRSLSALFLAALLLPGCGPPKAVEPANPEVAQVTSVICSLPDYTDNVVKLGRKFSKDAQPTEALRSRIWKYNFAIAGPIKIEGDTATAPVKLTLAQGGEAKGVFEWSAVKEGDIWKLKKTPLP